jgi:azurin
MAHNFVLLAKAADTLKFVNASAMARATDFVPPDMKAQVIAHTALAGAGETVEVTFKVPAAGTYTYLCTFPGHFQAGMRGTLTVK